MSKSDDRWIEAMEQSRRQTDDRWIFDRSWIDRDLSRGEQGELRGEVPPRFNLTFGGMSGLFQRYPALYILPALAFGAIAFLLVFVLLMV